MRSIDCTARADWAAVVAFYTAVHLVESLRAITSEHSQNHGERLAYLHAAHPAIYPDFRELYNLSLLARYYANTDFYNQIANEDVAAIVIPEWLGNVERYVEAFDTTK